MKKIRANKNAIQKFNIEKVKELLDENKIKDAHDYVGNCLSSAINYPDMEIKRCNMEMAVDIGIDAHYNKDSYFITCCGIDLSLVKLFVEDYGFDINTNNNGALYNAIFRGKIDIATYLLDNGAIIDDLIISKAVCAMGWIGPKFIDLLMNYGVDKYKLSEMIMTSIDETTINLLAYLSDQNFSIDELVQTYRGKNIEE